MKVGLALPSAIPGAGGVLVEWARSVEEGPYSTLAVIDRLAYDSIEALVTLGAVSAVTARVQLMASVIVAPLRNPVLLAKQALSLQVLTGGRFTLGLGVGAMRAEFEAIGEAFEGRGQRFDVELEILWATMTQAPPNGGRVGPSLGNLRPPGIVIGANTRVAIQRAAHYGEGFIAGSRSTIDEAVSLFGVLEGAWSEAGRTGRPRFIGGAYFVLGEGSTTRAAQYIHDYYRGDAAVTAVLEGVLTTAGAVAKRLDEAQDAGMDEFILWPCSADLDQVDLAADVVARFLM